MISVKNIFTIVFVLFVLKIFAQGEQGVSISENPEPPHESAMLHVFSNNKGMKIPTVELGPNLSDIIGIIKGDIAVDGLMVYNSGANQNKGFYYWDDDLKTWIKIGENCTPSSCIEEDWKIIGETGQLQNGQSVPALKYDHNIDFSQQIGTHNAQYDSLAIEGIYIQTSNLSKISIRKSCNGFVHINGYIYTAPYSTKNNLANYCIIDLPVGYRPVDDFVIEPIIATCRVYLKSESNSLCINSNNQCDLGQDGFFMYVDFKYLAQ